MFDALHDLVDAGAWSYLVVLAVVAVDAFFPVVPGETLAITAGVVAAGGSLDVRLVFLAALVGAVAGDNVSYALGAKLGRRAARRLFRGGRSRRMLAWARDQLERRGLVLIVAARFIPGGRTAVTFSSGALELAWRRFLVADVAGCTLWAAYATALGYFGGATFRESFWKPLAIALAVAALVSAAGEAVRRLKLTGDDAASRTRE